MLVCAAFLLPPVARAQQDPQKLTAADILHAVRDAQGSRHDALDGQLLRRFREV